MNLPRSYLTTKVSLAQVLADNEVDGLPFGLVNDDWERLLAKRHIGDELWNFAPPDEHAMRFWGVALVREGQIISTVITAVD